MEQQGKNTLTNEFQMLNPVTQFSLKTFIVVSAFYNFIFDRFEYFAIFLFARSSLGRKREVDN